jgi:hypothetical protein
MGAFLLIFPVIWREKPRERPAARSGGGEYRQETVLGNQKVPEKRGGWIMVLMKKNELWGVAFGRWGCELFFAP